MNYRQEVVALARYEAVLCLGAPDALAQALLDEQARRAHEALTLATHEERRDALDSSKRLGQYLTDTRDAYRRRYR